MKKRTVLAVAIPIIVLTAAIAAPALATETRTTLPDDVATWVRYSTPVGAADPAQVMPLRIYLAGQRPAQQRAADAMAVSTPHDPHYAHYLTPAAYTATYGTTPAQTARVTHWLTAQGITVTASTPHFIAVNATVAQIDTAFATTVRQFTDGLAAIGGASVPASLRTDIAAVTGLSLNIVDPNPNPKPGTPTPAATTTACSHYWGEHTTTIPTAYGKTRAPTVICGYTVAQLRHAYGVDTSPYHGQGATIAIILDGAAPTMLADANRYFAGQGVPGYAPGQYTEDLPPGGTGSCQDQPEEALDVETVHIIAPAANVVYVAAACGDGTETIQEHLLDAHFRVVDRHLADVATDSYAVLESVFTRADIVAWESALQQGALEGIGFNYDSGDFSGIEGDETAAVDFPASDPWATSVGGTSLQLGPDGRRISEYAWGDRADTITGGTYADALPGFLRGGSSGGVSALFNRPCYQQGVVPAALGPGKRVVPDVSAIGGTVWQIAYTQDDGVYRTIPEDGTSGSSPIIASLEASAKAAAGHAIGFANPALYRMGGTAALHDVVPVDPKAPPFFLDGDSLVSMGLPTELTVTRGYDDVTGVGAATERFVTAF